MNLQAPGTSNPILGRGVAARSERDSDGARVVQKAHDEGVRGLCVARNFSQPPEGVLGLVPEVGTDGENGVLETSGPHVAWDTFVTRGSGAKTGLAGEFSTCCANAHVAVEGVGLAVLIRGTSPVL